MNRFFFILIILLTFQMGLYSQERSNNSSTQDDSVNINLSRKPIKQLKFYEYCFDSSNGRRLYLYLVDRGDHEGFVIKKRPEQPGLLMPISAGVKITKNSFLKIHGNVLYDLNYYSNVDTPFSQRDVYQHTLQSYLDITVKDHYPIRLFFTTRFSNSRFIKNFTGANLLYVNNLFTRDIKERLKRKMMDSFQSLSKLDSLKNVLEIKYDELAILKASQNNPALLQKIVEAKEHVFFSKDGNSTVQSDSGINSLSNQVANIQSPDVMAGVRRLTDSARLLPSDSSFQNLQDSLLSLYDANKKRYDSLNKEVAILQKRYNDLQQQLNNTSKLTAKEIDDIKNPIQLKEKMRELNVPDSVMPAGYRTLMALRSIGIGRSVINYSELSVKNISVTGFQAEYNPSYYLAFAGGTVDYRFRDYVLQNAYTPKQYVGVLRAGLGMKDGNNIIFTYFAGRRQLYNVFTDTINQNIHEPSPYLMGFTVEGNYHIDKNNVITGELAKSSIPYYARSSKSENLASAMMRFNDHSNEAYSIKLASFIPASKTLINGYYKYFGINYQSFSIFTDGSTQKAFNLRVDQPFFNRTLDIAASISSNDFSNPYISHAYKSSTVFKSVQATLRKKKWPVISLGYFPSSQLIRLTGDQYSQSMFYTLIGNISHFYQLNHTTFSTTLLYTRFYNDSKDTGFVYFNTKNLLLNQTIFLKRFTFQFNGSEASNNNYILYQLGSNLQFKWNKWLNIGGGVKYNKQTVFNDQLIGYSANATIRVPFVGEFTMMVDRGFIPGPNRELVTNNVGHFTYFKTF